MSNAGNCKEEFLSGVVGVDGEKVIDAVRQLKDKDLYTYFVTNEAISSGKIDDADIREFLLHVYSDWYFLHKNASNKDTRVVRFFSETKFTPLKLNESNTILDMVKSHEYDDILPMSIQYVNQEEDRYFITIRTDALYGQKQDNNNYPVRLYLNLKSDNLLGFAKVMVDRLYAYDCPIIIKVLNNDYRSDDVVIYTDYHHAGSVVNLIKDIRFENQYLFSGSGELSVLLGKVDDYIGFGEVFDNDNTYFASRCNALGVIEKSAQRDYLRKSIVREEEKVISDSFGRCFTPSEYLELLITRSATQLIKNKISELKKMQPIDVDKIVSLESLLDDMSSVIDIKDEVNKLKKSFTRNTDYVLEIDGVGRYGFDYVNRIFNLFVNDECYNYFPMSSQSKKDKISEVFFNLTDTFEGMDTRGFLELYFKTKLSYILNDIVIDESMGLSNSKDSAVLIRLKKKLVKRLKDILKNINSDGDEGRVYIGRYICDLIRILSTDSLENVVGFIAGKEVKMDVDVPKEIVSLLPIVQKDVMKLTESKEYVDNILNKHNINVDNLCLTNLTTNECRLHSENIGDDVEFEYVEGEGYVLRNI